MKNVIVIVSLLTVLAPIAAFSQGNNGTVPGKTKGEDTNQPHGGPSLNANERAQTLADLRGQAGKLPASKRVDRSGLAATRRKNVRNQNADHFRTTAATARLLVESYDAADQESPLSAEEKLAWAEARGLEAMALFNAVESGDGELRPEAVERAKSIYLDRDIENSIRFEVAAKALHVEMRGRRFSNRTEYFTAFQEQAERLYAAFPADPRSWDMLLVVVNGAPKGMRPELIDRFLLKPLPVEYKERARLMLEADQAVGQPIELNWIDVEGEQISSANFQGSPLVFYVWSGSAQGKRTDHDVFLNAVSRSLNWISVNTDRNKRFAAAGEQFLKGAASYYYDSSGKKSGLYKALKSPKVPSVVVLDAQGVFVGRGDPSELTQLLGQAGN